MFKENNGPLMYINSVQTPSNKKFGQQVYDSRNPIKINSREVKEVSDCLKKEEKKELLLNEEEIELINKIINLRSNNSFIKCEFHCVDSDNMRCGVPISISDNILTIENENGMEELNLFEITKFYIS